MNLAEFLADQDCLGEAWEAAEADALARLLGFRGFGLEFSVSVFGVQISGFGFRRSVFGFGFWISGFGFPGSGFRVSCCWLGGEGVGLRIQAFGLKILGSGCGIHRGGGLLRLSLHAHCLHLLRENPKIKKLCADF